MACANPINLCPSFIGDDIFISLSFRDSKYDVIDLTGSTVTLTIKENISDVTPLYEEIQTDIDMIDPLSGILQFHVPQATTELFTKRTYHYDVTWDTDTGSHTTIIIGQMPISQPSQV